MNRLSIDSDSGFGRYLHQKPAPSDCFLNQTREYAEQHFFLKYATGLAF